MDGPRDYHTKWSKSERKRQIPYDITYMWNLKYDRNEPIYETETDSQTTKTDLRLPGIVGRMDWEFGINSSKLLYTDWINKNVLLYSTGNYIQYPVINHNGKEYEKECICIYIHIYMNHFAVQ